MPDDDARFREVMRTALDLIHAITVFLHEVDGESDSELVCDLAQIRAKVTTLTYDKDNLVPHSLPFPSGEVGPQGQNIGFTDTRINKLFEEAFPPGHRFHITNRRRMLHDLAKIKRIAEDMRRQISDGS